MAKWNFDRGVQIYIALLTTAGLYVAYVSSPATATISISTIMTMQHLGWTMIAVGIVLTAINTVLKRASRNNYQSPLELFNGVLRWREGRLKQVANQTFKNQEVRVDGIEFIDCIFDGVTFVYEGTGKVAMSGSMMKADANGKPNCLFRTSHPIVGATSLLLEGMQFFREGTKRRIETLPLDR